ncbi:glycosyltransferase [Planococcus sp. X10-3]|uniref:glycosyltransferase n=1 Tax=Planococcus sp. X10-3 TaxID=3061240 RepID=UPI003BAF59EB
MRIIVNNTAASTGGALTILNGFYDFLVNSERSKHHEWIFLLGGKYIDETENIKVVILEEAKKNWINRLKFDFYKGKSVVEDLDPDVVISLQNTILMGLSVPQVLYMHQALPFQREKNFSFFNKEEREIAVYQHIIGKLIKESVKKADFVIVQTKWIKEEVIKSTSISKIKISSILPPSEEVIEYKKENVFNKREFFYPADASIYKNHQCIYEASSLLNDRGIKNYQISLTIESELALDNFVYLGKLPFKSVLDKYNSSTLIFPSYVETLGLPLLEARKMGTIILAADCNYAREVLGEYENAYFFNPAAPEELSELMEGVLTGVINRKETKSTTNEDGNSWDQVLNILTEHGSDGKQR